MDLKREPASITEEEEDVAVANAQDPEVQEEEYQDYEVLLEEVEKEVAEEPDEDEQESFECKYCEFQTANIEELDEHIIGHEEEIAEEEEESLFELCEPEEDGGDQLQEQETTENGFELPIPQVYQKYPSFYEEFRNKAVKNIFACPFCGYQSMKKLDMNQHIRDHRSPIEFPIYRCSECYYTTLRKFDMPKHLLTHCDNYPKYECKECSYATKRKSDLNKHILGHSTKSLGKREYTCHVCSYSTPRQSDLKRHLLTHKSDKSLFVFNCTECGYSAKRLNDLNKHVALHCDRLVEGILKCPKCDYATVKASPFARHVLSQCKTKELPSYTYKTEQPNVVNENLAGDTEKHNGSEDVSSRKRKLPEHFDEYIVEDGPINEVVTVEQTYDTSEVVVLEGFES